VNYYTKLPPLLSKGKLLHVISFAKTFEKNALWTEPGFIALMLNFSHKKAFNLTGTGCFSETSKLWP